MKAVFIRHHGGPEVLKTESVAPPESASQVIVDVAWAGVNFVDVYQREGRYPGLSLPFVPGIEAAGIVVNAPKDSGFLPGQRVAFAGSAKGAHGELVAVPPDGLVHVPDDISLRDAAASLEQALTADILIDRVARIPVASPDQTDWAVVHAAAGGVGTWLLHMLQAKGIKVLGLASSAEKAAIIEQIGAYAVRNDLADQPWRDAVLRITQGRAPQWVFDSVGAATFDDSLAVLANCGHLILYGAASGQVSPVDVVRLMVKSATLTRPMMAHYFTEQSDLQRSADHIFTLLREHPDWLAIHSEWSLEQAAEAHAAMVSRERIGKVLLKVSGAQ